MKRKMMHIIACISIVSLVMTGCGATTATGTDEAESSVVAENTVAADVNITSKETTSEETTSEETAPTAEPTPTVEPAVESTETPASETPASEAAAATAETPSAEPAPAYTYTDMSATMYAKSPVNVRDLPSTDGARVGGLTTNQEVTVTGQCVETGWYRIQYKDGTAYVSNNYIVTEKVSVQTASAGSHIEGSKSTDNPLGISEDDFNKFAEQMFAGNNGNSNNNSSYATDGYFDRAMAEEVFALVNAERRDAGIAELVWDESLYEIATQRCYENDIHAGMRAGTSENQASGQIENAQELHQGWHDSAGHYANYMNANHTNGAVAVYKIPQGDFGGLYLIPSCVAYEVFSSGNTSASAQSNQDTIVANAYSNPYVTSMTINGETVFDKRDSVTAAKTDDTDSDDTENTEESSDSTVSTQPNVGWSLTPPEPTNGLEEWKNKNPGVQVEVNTN